MSLIPLLSTQRPTLSKKPCNSKCSATKRQRQHPRRKKVHKHSTWHMYSLAFRRKWEDPRGLIGPCSVSAGSVTWRIFKTFSRRTTLTDKLYNKLSVYFHIKDHPIFSNITIFAASYVDRVCSIASSWVKVNVAACRNITAKKWQLGTKRSSGILRYTFNTWTTAICTIGEMERCHLAGIGNCIAFDVQVSLRIPAIHIPLTHVLRSP